MNKRRLLIKIAKYYYIDKYTQEEIAKKLSLSRQKVNRLMKQLIPEGIIKIIIDDTSDEYADMEYKLEKKFGLKEVVIVDNEDGSEQTLLNLSKAGAEYLTDKIKEDSIVGMTWGRTLRSLVDYIHTDKNYKNTSFVQLIGGASLVVSKNYVEKLSNRQSNEITKRIAEKFNGTPYLTYAPLILENKNAKDILMKETSVSAVFNKAKQCDMMLISVGGIGENITPFREGLLGKDTLEFLLKEKAVGNFLFKYYDIDGNFIPYRYDDQIMIPKIEDILSIPDRICIAGRVKEKGASIYGAIKGKLINILITDNNTAKFLLETE